MKLIDFAPTPNDRICSNHFERKWFYQVNDKMKLLNGAVPTIFLKLPSYLQVKKDNCASFDRLIPCLNKDVGFLALDLPGHGYSARLPRGMYYHFTNAVILIRYLVRYFQWPKVALMGHSLGGMISYFYSMLYPDGVDFLICLEGSKPLICGNHKRIGDSIDNFVKYNEHAAIETEPPSFTLKELKHRVNLGNLDSVEYEHLDLFMGRNIAPSKLHPGNYYFTRDPRLKLWWHILNFNQDELVRGAESMVMPIFIAKAREASYYEPEEFFYNVLDVLKRTSADCDFHYIKGTHHAHFNNPEEVGELINRFIQRHNIVDRDIHGLKDLIAVDNEETHKISHKMK